MAEKNKKEPPTPEIKPPEQEKQQTQPTQEQEIARRQSYPKPTAEQEAMRLMGGNMVMSGIDGFRALQAPIGKEALQKATYTLNRYRTGKTNLERRVIENEDWYKLRNWENMRKGRNDFVEPTSAWLFNSIQNKKADAMDNFPSANILPREEGDKGEAEMLSSIIPVILDQNDFEGTYDEVSLYKLVAGTGVYGIFWDADKLNGLGDISIKKIDLLSLFWEPGIEDIQDSRNIFHVELMDNDVLIEQYPQLQGKLGSANVDIAKYNYDDTVDTSNKSAVIDWYYKKRNSRGKQVLHYVKYVNDVVLFASENETTPKTDDFGNVIGEAMADRGLYDHGQYPYVFDPLFATEGTPTGFSYIDVGKNTQEYIDRTNQAIMKNMLVNAKPRYFIRGDGSVKESEFADMTKDFIHVDGNLGQDSVLPVTGNVLSSVYVDMMQLKVDELKETTGNRDVSTGGTSGGVTAASAISAMQEAGSKLSRDNNKASYRNFRKIILLVIELIRQFYGLVRCFRIMGANGTARFVEYSNAGIQPQWQGEAFGQDMGMRIPLFDVEVTAQKQSPYSKLSQNELALQFYQAQFFNPAMAQQALLCLNMMDFNGKNELMQKIAQNGGMLQQMMMLAAVADEARGGNEFQMSIAQQYGLQVPHGFVVKAGNKESLGGNSYEESTNTKKARQRVADSTSPT